MKKRLFLLLVLLMMLSVANAEEWVSIKELRVQTPSHWTKTYETKWRTIVIDAQINIPQVDRAPVILIEGGAEEPTFTAADIGWDSLRFRGAYYHLLIDAQTGEVVKRSNAQDRCEYKGYISWNDLAK